LWVVIVIAVALYVGLAKAGVIRTALFPVTRGDIELARSNEPGLRILFVGNSFTFYNDMPHMLHELAAQDPGARPIFAVQRTRNSWTLHGASEDKGLDSLLEDVQWDDVVIQERSWYLAEPAESWLRDTYPYADELRLKIDASGAEGIVLETWGYRDGMTGRDLYAGMQGRLWKGTAKLAGMLGMDMAPVGNAWYDAHAKRPELDLWDGDGRHPNRAGSYLAACVLYAMLTGRDPAQSDFTAGLDPSDAAFLQQTAQTAVSWN
jgi:hypothetical protein